MVKKRSIDDSEGPLPPYPQEAILIDAIPGMAADRLMCMSAGLAQFAVAAADAFPNAAVSCTYLDLYRANLAANHSQNSPPNLTIECAADLPNEEADVVALPFSARGEAELTRDLLQQAHERLRTGGKLFASIDNDRDTWLHEQLRSLFGNITVRKFPHGNLYSATKTAPLKKVKNLACEFVFRDKGRLIRAVSRPGVFSHRHVDVGARRLMDEMQIEPGTRILDIGCGSGVVALAAACRLDSVTVHAVDSSARAIQCTEQGAKLNGLTNLTTELNAEGHYAGRGTFELALANPPYYSSFRIAEHFLTVGREALRIGGKMIVVTKRPDWYEENMPNWYGDVAFTERKGYWLVHGVRPAGDRRR